MAKTSDAIPQACMKLELADCSSGSCGAYTDVSGHSMSVSGTTQSRATAETPVFGDDTPVVTPGKRGAVTPTFAGIYTENDADAFKKALALFEETACDGGRICVKWSPGGGDVGDIEYEIRCGIIQDFGYPMGEASAAEPVIWSFTVFADQIYHDTISS